MAWHSFVISSFILLIINYLYNVICFFWGFILVSLLLIANLLLDVLKYIVIAQIVLSWLINFNILNIHQPLINQIWRGINQVLEPLYGQIRRRMPYTGAIDFAPLIVFIAILALQIIIRNNIGNFY